MFSFFKRINLIILGTLGFNRGPPIQNIGNVDVMFKRKDGVLELLVVTASRLDGSPETQKLVLDKIQPYLDFLQSEDCKNEFGELSQEQKLVVLRCYEEPNAAMLAFFPRVAQWVRDSGATFEVRHGR